MGSLKNKLKYFILLLVLTTSIANDFIMRPKWGLIKNAPQEYYSSFNEQSNINDIADEYYSENELDSNVQFGIQTISDDDDKQMNEFKNREMKKSVIDIKYFSLCPEYEEIVYLNRDLNNEYEYKPEHYVEITCLSPENEQHNSDNKVCGRHNSNFACIQVNRTIFLTKRLKGTSCWQFEQRLISFGCECMWPKHIKGDIKSHH